MRAQASLEFLVTYGWAIALVIVVLSWIAYMGFANPTDFAGDDCRVSGEFGCQEAKLSAPSSVTASEASFVLRNLQSEKISVQEVIVEYDSQEFNCTRFQNLDGSDLTFVRSGEEFEVLCDDNALQLPAGQKTKLSFTITYNASVGFPKKASGEIVGLVDDSQTAIAFCGDGTSNNDEDCDDGEGNTNSCSADYDETCDYCSTECKTVTVQGPYCGDDTHDSSQEQCDDGNDDNFDGCTNACEFTLCDKELVGDDGGCTNTVDSLGESPETAGDESCTQRGAAYCVSCNDGYEWVSDDCVLVTTPVDAVCGSHNMTFAYDVSEWPTGTFCEEGSVSLVNPAFPNQGSSVSWDCLGENNGKTAECTAAREEAPVCPETCDPETGPTCQEDSDSFVTCVDLDGDGCFTEVTTDCDPDQICESGSCVPNNTCSTNGDCKEFAETCDSGTASCSFSGSCTCGGVYK